jgi:DNA-binding LacI/PurR family transcriptional regulator
LHAEHRGAIAAQLMLERLSEPKRPTQKIVVEPTLIIRETTECK